MPDIFPKKNNIEFLTTSAGEIAKIKAIFNRRPRADTQMDAYWEANPSGKFYVNALRKRCFLIQMRYGDIIERKFRTSRYGSFFRRRFSDRRFGRRDLLDRRFLDCRFLDHRLFRYRCTGFVSR